MPIQGHVQQCCTVPLACTQGLHQRYMKHNWTGHMVVSTRNGTGQRKSANWMLKPEGAKQLLVWLTDSVWMRCWFFSASALSTHVCTAEDVCHPRLAAEALCSCPSACLVEPAAAAQPQCHILKSRRRLRSHTHDSGSKSN